MLVLSNTKGRVPRDNEIFPQIFCRLWFYLICSSFKVETGKLILSERFTTNVTENDI